MRRTRIVACLMMVAMLLGMTGTVFAADEKYEVSNPDAQGIVYVTNTDGETLGYSVDSGVELLVVDGYAFKDLNKNEKLDPYEDWRLTTAQRAENLASLMVADGEKGIKAIAGLMLYSSHTSVNSEEISASTMTALTDEYLRHVLVTGITSTDENVSATEVGAKWSNNVQAYVEGIQYGIPANNSSDPRHSASSSNVEYNIGNSGSLSLWPSSIGLAATFDPDAVLEFGQIASAEYRALGIATALSPQIDLATDPRWSRFSGTFGEDSTLATDMSRAYVDGFQSTFAENFLDAENAFDIDEGWGSDSVNAMVKHWPGGGSGEGGRDAHYNYGKFAVYPGDNFDEHLLTFTEGAFKLDGKTETATAVMPYYTISYDQDPEGDNVGNSYSRYIIQDLLRGEYEFEGVICTDWNIVYDVGSPYSFGGMCWGLENEDITDRFIRLLETGIDQFGGVNTIEYIMNAYNKMVTDSGKTVADTNMREHAERLLTNIFNTGLFENPYLDVAESVAAVGNSDFMAAGYETQQNSVVMLKNSDDVISADGLDGKVYIANASDYKDSEGNVKANPDMYSNYWGSQYVDNIADADYAVIVINAPSGGGGFDSTEVTEETGNGYKAITLQYGDYTATTAREQSIASNSDVYFNDWSVTDRTTGITTTYPGRYDVANRSYKDKTTSIDSNLTALANYNEITAAAEEAGIPVIVYMRASNPMVWSEIEPAADAIVVGYSIQTQAAFDIINGEVEPSAMLPAQQPANMETVEAQYEDVAHDMECYVDADGNIYDFGFGLNYSGTIGVDTDDARWDEYVEEYAWKNPYADVDESDWYYTPIKIATYKGYVQGLDKDGVRVFEPEEKMTREQFVKILANVAEKAGEEITGTSTFKDVASSRWSYDVIGWAQETGIIEGFTDGTFRPEENMTREQMCKMIALYAEYMGIEFTGDDNRTFTDASSVQSWAKEYVELLTKAGIIEGYEEEDGTYTFRPQDNASRAEVTKVAVGVFG